jgi:hypothetical protein
METFVLFIGLLIIYSIINVTVTSFCLLSLLACSPFLSIAICTSFSKHLLVSSCLVFVQFSLPPCLHFLHISTCYASILLSSHKSKELPSIFSQHYTLKNVTDTNRDVIPDDLVSIFHKATCGFGFATHLFGTELKALYAEEPVPRGISFRDVAT